MLDVDVGHGVRPGEVVGPVVGLRLGGTNAGKRELDGSRFIEHMLVAELIARPVPIAKLSLSKLRVSMFVLLSNGLKTERKSGAL